MTRVKRQNNKGRAAFVVPAVARKVWALLGVCALGAAPLMAQVPGDHVTASGNGHYSLGAVRSSAASFAGNPKIKVIAKRGGARPESLILTDYLPPIFDQGKQGSCVACSSGYYAYSYAVSKNRQLTEGDRGQGKWLFSPAFIYHLGNNGLDQGMPISQAMTILKDQGCATLAEMPYNDTDFTSPVPPAATTRAAKFKALEVASLFQGPGTVDADKLKTFLADMHQPFVIAIPVYEEFFKNPADNVYTHTPGSAFAGRHAVCICGYDDTKHAFRMVNSWGPDWCDHGFVWLSEDFVTKEAFEGWAFVAGGGFARGHSLPASISIVPPR